MAYGYGYGYNGQTYMPGNVMQNQYQQRLAQMEQASMPRYDIIHVNGENGARAFRMGPNSNALLMDDTAPIVWLCQSDGAGYHTVTPYSIAPYQAETPVDARALEKRVADLEAALKRMEAGTDAKPDA